MTPANFSFNATLKKYALKLRHKRRLYYSRKAASKYLKEIREIQGRSYVSRKLEKRIKSYAGDRFGSKGYADWLIVYTELRGEFKEGWIPDDFFSYEFLPYINREHLPSLSELKSFDHRLFDPYIIKPIARRVNGIYFDSKDKKIDRSQFIAQIRAAEREVVIKKDSVQSGLGIEFISASDVSIKNFQDGSDYIVQPSVQQHPTLNKIHQYSVNTIRVTTFINASSEVIVKHRSLRMGDSNHRMVNQSGIFLFLNENGEAISNIYSKIGIDQGPLHPHTGIDLRVQKIPGVKQAVNICKKMHLRFPYIRFIAWDLYVDKHENPNIIEWNAIFPGMWENEALIGPLWSEDEIDELMCIR